jgi:hypothetical protein
LENRKIVREATNIVAAGGGGGAIDGVVKAANSPKEGGAASAQTGLNKGVLWLEHHSDHCKIMIEDMWTTSHYQPHS